MLTAEGDVKLLDFGIALSSMEGRERTSTGIIKGKAAYMSPEQALGDGDLDGRSGLFSLGVLLVELITGKNLFEAGSETRTLLRITQADPSHIYAALRRLSPRLRIMLRKALARDREDRYPIGQWGTWRWSQRTRRLDRRYRSPLAGPMIRGACVSDGTKPVGRNYDTVSLRLMTYERDLFDAATEALSDPDARFTHAPLFSTAGLEEAHRLGVYTGVDPLAPPDRATWSNLPRRPEGISAKERLTVTLHPAHYGVVARAAELAEVSVPLFLVGSALHYLANVKRANARLEHHAAPARRSRFRPALKHLRLPRQYEPFPKDFDEADPDWF